METARTIAELDGWLNRQTAGGRSVGFVPTMGALHEGHLSLVRRSVAENDLTVCSIFVNPIQFNNPRDLEHYPRMPEKDREMLSDSGCDLVFMPGIPDMYPEPVTKVYDFGQLDKVMEGAFRPGHFNGVAVVVNRLFGLVRPTRSYFGLKDYQQLLIIREMAKQEGHTSEIIGCPIIREKDGLAMSSRNLRLTPEQRVHAAIISKALFEAKECFRDHTAEELRAFILGHFNGIPDCRPEYVEVADAETLQPVRRWADASHCVVCVAVFFGEIRLIDNMMLY